MKTYDEEYPNCTLHALSLHLQHPKNIPLRPGSTDRRAPDLLLEYAPRWGKLVLDYTEYPDFYAFCRIVRQLGRMTQLRSLTVEHVSEEEGPAWMEVLKSISEILSADDLAKLELFSSLSLYDFVGDHDEELDYISTAFLSPNITTLSISVTLDIAVMMLEACPNLLTACFTLPLEKSRISRDPRLAITPVFVL
ncbi:hypothetical protein PM082_009717 [Marasmius tenuissimus]|nr:hypothetical protein PM082_009717 [Marasmius tenuissimus]